MGESTDWRRHSSGSAAAGGCCELDSLIGMTLWEDLTHSELQDAKFLFPDPTTTTIATENCGFQTAQGVQVHEPFESSMFFQATNPPPVKRRRLLFNEDLTTANLVNRCSSSGCGTMTSYEPIILDPFKVVGQDDDDDAFRSSCTSGFCNDASEDIPDGMQCSSSENYLKISAESWMDACIKENDRSESYITARGGPLCEFSVLQNSIELCPSPYSTEPYSEEGSLHNTRTPLSSQPSTPGSNASMSRKLKITIPLAYPFTLLKPSDHCADGDGMALSDINQLLLKPPTTTRSGDDDAAAGHFFGGGSDCLGRTKKLSDLGMSLSGKSIVTCTRICTEGKGTITILRTKD